MLTKRQRIINLDVEMTKNFNFSVSYHPKELKIKDGEVFINHSKHAGKFVGIFYILKRINTASTKSIWESKFIVGDSEQEVKDSFKTIFETRYKTLINKNIK